MFFFLRESAMVKVRRRLAGAGGYTARRGSRHGYSGVIAAARMGRGLNTGRQRSIMHRAARKPRAPLDATTTVSISCRDHQARV